MGRVFVEVIPFTFMALSSRVGAPFGRTPDRSNVTAVVYMFAPRIETHRSSHPQAMRRGQPAGGAYTGLTSIGSFAISAWPA